MDKRGVLILVFVVLIVTLSLLFFWQWYIPTSNNITKYPGKGEVTTKVDEKLFVLPKEEGAPFFAPMKDASKYPDTSFDVTYIPPQTQLLYTVGKFKGWEDIEASKDKYIVINDSTFAP